eukprot:SAG11_NODE_1562_length_4676_cov_2.366616_7_plen_83_part_00
MECDVTQALTDRSGAAGEFCERRYVRCPWEEIEGSEVGDAKAVRPSKEAIHVTAQGNLNFSSEISARESATASIGHGILAAH